MKDRYNRSNSPHPIGCFVQTRVQEEQKCGQRPVINVVFELSGKAHEFRISWSSIGANAIGLEPIIHVGLSGLVKGHPPLLHDFENLLLGSIIKSSPAVAFQIASQVKGTAGETGLNVAREAAGQSRVYIVCARQSNFGDMGTPIGSSEEERGSNPVSYTHLTLPTKLEV